MRILIVEDEPKVTRTLVKSLEADHFAVDVAQNGEEGLQLFTEIDYDLDFHPGKANFGRQPTP